MIPDNLGDEATICSNKHQQIISILSYAKVSALSGSPYFVNIVKRRICHES